MVHYSVPRVKGGIYELKEKLAHLKPKEKEKYLIVDKLQHKDTVILVIPVDESAPKGRLILPQQLLLLFFVFLFLPEGKNYVQYLLKLDF